METKFLVISIYPPLEGDLILSIQPYSKRSAALDYTSRIILHRRKEKDCIFLYDIENDKKELLWPEEDLELPNK